MKKKRVEEGQDDVLDLEKTSKSRGLKKREKTAASFHLGRQQSSNQDGCGLPRLRTASHSVESENSLEKS